MCTILLDTVHVVYIYRLPCQPAEYYISVWIKRHDTLFRQRYESYLTYRREYSKMLKLKIWRGWWTLAGPIGRDIAHYPSPPGRVPSPPGASPIEFFSKTNANLDGAAPEIAI